MEGGRFRTWLAVGRLGGTVESMRRRRPREDSGLAAWYWGRREHRAAFVPRSRSGFGILVATGFFFSFSDLVSFDGLGSVGFCIWHFRDDWSKGEGRTGRTLQYPPFGWLYPCITLPFDLAGEFRGTCRRRRRLIGGSEAGCQVVTVSTMTDVNIDDSGGPVCWADAAASKPGRGRLMTHGAETPNIAGLAGGQQRKQRGPPESVAPPSQTNPGPFASG